VSIHPYIAVRYVRRVVRQVWYSPNRVFGIARLIVVKLARRQLVVALNRPSPRLAFFFNSDCMKSRTIGFKARTENHSVSIVIPNKNSVRLMIGCLRSIRMFWHQSATTITIVDNDSTSSSISKVYEFFGDRLPLKIVKGCHEFNFSRLVNLGAAADTSEFILLFNNDVRPLAAFWLEDLIDIALATEASVVGAVLLYPDNTIQHAGVVNVEGRWEHLDRYTSIAEFDAQYPNLPAALTVPVVTGAVQLIPRRVWEALVGYDESFPTNDGDVDFCLRAKPFGPVVLATKVRLIHIESASRGYGRDGS
jgi:O-antigen biosynthesis protein